MSDSVAGRMQPGNRSLAESAARITKTVLDQSMAGLSVVDPLRMARLAGKFVQSSGQVVSGSSGDHDDAHTDIEDDEPQLAADILDGPQH